MEVYVIIGVVVLILLIFFISGKVMEYLREINPEDMKRVDRLKLECWSEDGGELYFEFCEDPLAQDWDGVLVIVKVRPEWQVVYYSCLSNG